MRRIGTIALLLPAAMLLLVIFVTPLLRLFVLSLSAEAGPLSAYAQLLGDEVYRRVFYNTVVIAVAATAISVVVSYPLAMALVRLSPGWRALMFGCILLPLWISVLVRTFSWLLLLERNGPINRSLVATGIVATPLAASFHANGGRDRHGSRTDALLRSCRSMRRWCASTRRCCVRATGLGASRLTTFRRILLPLSSRGVATAATFMFLLSFGFFITPAVLGGAKSTTCRC